MDEQERVAEFIDDHDLRAPVTYRTLDLTAEVGEIAAAVAKSTAYGAEEGAVSVPEDEVGDALFALLALAEGLDIDARAALDNAVSKYERRIESDGGPGSETGGV
jgi:NTP pyrophosphatase (non-canonical NTP hydrolase)